MVERLVDYGVQYVGYLLEVGLLGFLLYRGKWNRLRAVSLYLAGLLLIDAVGRPWVLSRYGLASVEYAYFYWLTDVLLAMGAFLLVCALFRRACLHEAKMWRFLRLLLVFVFILVLGISSFSLSRNYKNLYTIFIVEFQQNLYFTCLVLNTLLYILLQQIESADDELGLLVCGMGLQFAGPAANLALVYLTPGHRYASSLMTYVSPLCTLGMLVTWFYALVCTPAPAKAPFRQEELPALAEAAPRQP